MEMIGDRVMVDLRDGPFLRPDAGRAIAEMVDGERNVGGGRLADRLAVVDGLRHGETGQIVLPPLGDAVEDIDRNSGVLGTGGAVRGDLGGRGNMSRRTQ